MDQILRRTGKLTLAAASMLLIGAGVSGTASAADLGKGGCCGDLEERVAELEATTARKGNRVVSLEISGQVNKALLFWDDGVDSDAYVVDPDSDGSRFRFTGKAQLKPGWTAGYTMELNVVDAASNRVFNDDNGDDPADNLSIRRNFLYIESDRLGRLSLGQENQATDGINEIGVVTTYSTVSKTHYAGAFELRDSSADTFSGVLWQDILGAVGGGQEDIVKYDTPSIYGFILSASWGDNDIYDVALRFQKEWNSVKIAAGIGYLKDDRDDSLTIVDDQLSGSISAQHIPSGLFLTFAAASRDQRGTDEDATNLYIQGGISRKWLPYGTTTFWADYAKFEGFSEGLELDAIPGRRIGGDVITSSEADVWGFGVVQSFDSAALNVYALAQFFDADVSVDGGALDTEDHFAVVIGSHIKF
jgi:predicted porin